MGGKFPSEETASKTSDSHSQKGMHTQAHNQDDGDNYHSEHENMDHNESEARSGKASASVPSGASASKLESVIKNQDYKLPVGGAGNPPGGK